MAGVRISEGEIIVMKEVVWVGGLDHLGDVGAYEAVLVIVRPVHTDVPSEAAAEPVHSLPRVASRASHHSQTPGGSAIHVPPGVASGAPSVHEPSRVPSQAPSIHETSRVPSRVPSVVNV